VTSYEQFLAEKVAFQQSYGFEVAEDEVICNLLPHQAAIVRWAVAGGRRALFESFGLGKSVQQLEILRLILTRHPEQRALIVCPLGVRQEFARDAREILEIEQPRFVRRDDEVDGPGIYITNYESVRDGRLDPNQFVAVSLDEASVLRSFGSKTYQTFLTLFDQVPYRFVATATPSPNRFKELIHYAGFLGVMDTGQALTRFFQRDSTKANNLTLYPHKTREFWLWLSTWAIFLQSPADICECQCHDGKTSSATGSARSSSNPGTRPPSETEPGSADATAAEHTSRRPATSSPVESSAAAASARSTEERAAARTTSGGACATDAAARTTRTGLTTEAAASRSASVGSSSPTSSKTWENRRPVTQSTGSTTTGTTNPTTVDGPLHSSRHETEGLDAECDACFCDGYVLPPVEVVEHVVQVDHSTAQVEQDGQARLFRGGSLGVVDAAHEKRDSIDARVAAAMEIVDGQIVSSDGGGRGDQIIIWVDLNDEQRAIERALAQRGLSFSSIDGSLDVDETERRLAEWRDRRTIALIGKPVMLGQGVNLQQCNRAIFVGLTAKFNSFIQAVHRIQRYGQTRTCYAHLIYAESETEVVRTLYAKWAQHKELVTEMTNVIREHGLNAVSATKELTRTIGVKRVQAKGEGWLVANNDCVPETRSMATNSVDLIVTSIPFSNHYEYTPSYNDFGHTDDNAHFWAQMDYLTPQLLRVLAPGRIYACHVKDRILFGAVTGAGVPTVSPFHAEAIFHARKHGFDYLGMITVVTDVVRENNQTYRLGWSEMAKDGTKMGVGSPEYVLLFHKPQTDRSRGYADTPVVKDKAQYSRARWQVDASPMWRSSGNRLITPEELIALPVDQRSRLFTDWTLSDVYDYETHVRIGEALDAKGALPSTFMSLAPGSHHPDVWHDVNRMLTLNTEQSRKAQAMHVCPLQFDIVDRLITRYSNPGDLVYDPFGGLFTVPLRALELGRRGRGVELNTGYFLDGVKYLEAAERKRSMPSLFDLAELEQVAG
jgi:hypothetical protein